jgi:hypothetical protein
MHVQHNGYGAVRLAMQLPYLLILLLTEAAVKCMAIVSPEAQTCCSLNRTPYYLP